MTSETYPQSVFDNPNSDRVKRYRSLQNASARKRNGLLLVEGPNAVRELVFSSPEKIESLYMTQAAAERYSDISEEFVKSAKRFAKRTPAIKISPLTIATEEVINTISENAQGVLAVAQFGEFDFGKQFATADEVVDLALHHIRDGQDHGSYIVAILHNVRDPGNAGTVIRSAQAMGADLVILSGESVEISNPKVIRSSVGTVFKGPVIAFKDLSAIVHSLKKRNWQVLAATGPKWPCVNILDPDLDLVQPTAWIFGNEAWGLTADDAALADERVAIPLFGGVESLNLAIAAAICLFATASAQSKEQNRVA